MHGLEGFGVTAAGLISSIPHCTLGVPHSLHKFAFKAARTFISTACKFEAIYFVLFYNPSTCAMLCWIYCKHTSLHTWVCPTRFINSPSKLRARESLLHVKHVSLGMFVYFVFNNAHTSTCAMV